MQVLFGRRRREGDYSVVVFGVLSGDSSSRGLFYVAVLVLAARSTFQLLTDPGPTVHGRGEA
jgi:hypothetical protein